MRNRRTSRFDRRWWENAAITVAVWVLFLVGGVGACIIYNNTPCEVFAMSATKDIPARCLKFYSR